MKFATKNRKPRQGPGLCGAAAAACLLVLAAVAPAAADRLTRVNGEASEERIVAIEGGRLMLSNATLALDEVWRIARAPVVAAGSGAVERVILSHGELPAWRIAVADGTCRFDWQGAAAGALPRAAVRALVFAAGVAPAARVALAHALEKPSSTDQVLALGADNLPLPITGTISAISSKAVAMLYQGQERSIARSRVCAVVFGTTSAATRVAVPLPWQVTTLDGAWVESSRVNLADGLLTIDVATGALSVPWQRVARLEYRGRQLRFLSDLEPAAVTQAAIVTLPLAWQRNRNVMGQPLRLNGDPCDRGLGLHAPAELTFELPARACRFLATVGLDEEYGRQGDCVVTVLADGREFFRRRLRGADAPQAVDVAVRSAGQLVLRVEPGENLDIGDHVNWYDARLLVEP